MSGLCEVRVGSGRFVTVLSRMRSSWQSSSRMTRERFSWAWFWLVLVGTLLVVGAADWMPPRGDSLGSGYAALWLVPGLFTALGVIIATKQPGNRISRLFLLVGFVMLINVWADLKVGLRTPTPAGVSDVLAVVAFNAAYMAGVMIPLLLLLFIFPTGKFMTRRWSWAGFAAGLGAVTVLVAEGFAEQVTPYLDSESARWTIDNPFGFLETATMENPPFVFILAATLLPLLGGGVTAIIVRYRRSSTLIRAQIRWVVYALFVFVLVGALPGLFFGVYGFWLIASMMLIPVSVAVAITRYRLFDIDRLISRTLAYTLVVATLTIAYLAVILGVGAIAAAFSPTDTDLPIPVVATALVAIAFQPVRKRALRVADRLVFGKHRTPYEALAGIEDVELDRLLPRIAQLVTESTAAQGAIVWLSKGAELEPAAVFPAGAKAPGQIPLLDGQIPRSPELGEVFPLLYQRTLIGAITTLMDQDEELPAVDVRLLKDLASRAATTINGVLEATPLPDGIVTFLLTDIEGSTKLWEEDPERMAVALRKHDELVQRLVREGGGVLVKWKGEGDSTFSVFTDPGEAVEAAMALQDAIQSNLWDLVRPISIRAALHTGEAELRERDYFGQTVNRCARIRSLVHGGQTLVSAATRELARSATPESLTFKDLGEHQLQDFKQPEHVYEVIIRTGAGTTEPQETDETRAP